MRVLADFFAELADLFALPVTILSDEEAFSSDWQTVGRDLWTAYERERNALVEQPEDRQ